MSTQGVLGALLRTCLLGTLVPADCPGPGPIRSGPSWLMGPKHVFNRCCLQGNTFVFYSFCSRYTKPSVEKAIQVSSSGNKATSNLIMRWQTGPRMELSAQSLVPGILRCEIVALRVPCTWELPSQVGVARLHLPSTVLCQARQEALPNHSQAPPSPTRVSSLNWGYYGKVLWGVCVCVCVCCGVGGVFHK